MGAGLGAYASRRVLVQQWRHRDSSLVEIARQPHAGELPPRRSREEITIGRSNVRTRRRERAAAKHELIAHELAIVFADGTVRRAITGIRRIRALGPLPNVAEHLPQRF